MIPAKSLSDTEDPALRRLRHQAFLEVSAAGVFFLDAEDVVVESNQAAWRLCETTPVQRTDLRIQDLLGDSCPDLIGFLEKSRGARADAARRLCRLHAGGQEKSLQVSVWPLLSEESGEAARLGTMVCLEETSAPTRQPSTVEQLRAVKMANEKLERAIQELHLSNEQLAAAGEELRSLNHALETMNEEHDLLSKELALLGERYAHTLNQLPHAVAIIGADGKIQLWNSAAERLFCLAPAAAIGLDLCQLPLPQAMRQAIAGKYRALLERGSSTTLRNQIYQNDQTTHRLDIHLASLQPGSSAGGVLLMFLQPSVPDRLAALRESDNFIDFAAS